MVLVHFKKKNNIKYFEFCIKVVSGCIEDVRMLYRSCYIVLKRLLSPIAFLLLVCYNEDDNITK